MTIETRTTIQLKDIKGIEFECEECHGKIVFAIDNFKNPPVVCSCCRDGKQWLIPESQDFLDLKQLGHIIQWFSSKAPERFTMRLEIATNGGQ
jgi:hypothetical protein